MKVIAKMKRTKENRKHTIKVKFSSAHQNSMFHKAISLYLQTFLPLNIFCNMTKKHNLKEAI